MESPQNMEAGASQGLNVSAPDFRVSSRARLARDGYRSGQTTKETIPAKTTPTSTITTIESAKVVSADPAPPPLPPGSKLCLTSERFM